MTLISIKDNFMSFFNWMYINESWLILAETIRYQTVAFSIIIVLLQWFIIKNQRYNLPSPQVWFSVSTHNLIKESKPYKWHLNKSMLSSCCGAMALLTSSTNSSLHTDVHWHTKISFTVAGWRKSSTISFFCFQCSWLNWQTNFKEGLAYWQ